MNKKGLIITFICCVILLAVFSIGEYMHNQHKSVNTGKDIATSKSVTDYIHPHKNDVQNQKDQFLFTVVMPTYNRAFCIENAINSLLQQTNQNFQLIIIDDGSIDNTEKLIEKNMLII